MQAGILIGAAAREFALAGNAKITLVSRTTGTRYTYKVVRIPEPKGPASHFVRVLSGPDNETHYTYLGAIIGGNFVHGHKSQFSTEAACARVLAWAWPRLGKHPLLEVWHEGRCGACGRTLTVPESLARGIGPECARRGAGAQLLLAPLTPEREPNYGHGRRRVA